jgi:hypothetical protein
MSARPTTNEGSTPTMTTPRRRRGRRILRAMAGALGIAAASLAYAAPAQADGLEFTRFETRFVNLDANGDEHDATQAGSHPSYLSVLFRLQTGLNWRGGLIPAESAKDVDVELPPGVIGNPEATPRCSMVDFAADRCPREAIVGVIDLRYNTGRVQEATYSMPVYNVTPPEGTVARMAFRMLVVDTVMDVRLNSDGRYTIETNTRNISQLVAVYEMRLRLFGVPADLNGPGPLRYDGGTYGGRGPGLRIPYLTLPSRCGPVGPATIRGRSWRNPQIWVEETSTPAPLTGCDRGRFDASLEVTPQTPRAGVPSATEMTLRVAQNSLPDGIATPPVKKVTATLPQGMVVSLSAADGLVGCTDAQAALYSLADPSCPSASRIGSVQIDTPVLPGPLTGSVYLGKPLSMRAANGDMLRLFLVAKGHGVTIKQEGRITPDPLTGQLRAVFDDAPEQPFERLTLVFNGGPKAPLTNPRQCGTYTTAAQITSVAGHVADSTSSFAITQNADGGPCAPLGFAPAFAAGMANPSAGASSTFTLGFGRSDSDQDLGDLSVRLPAGVMGMVSQAELCDEAAANAGTCGEASRIGSVRVAAGAGTSPFQLSGRGVYLTGPYKGGAFGLSIVIPAVAGPFDLGSVVVRSAIHVDRKTAALTIVSDQFPTILEGIPLRVRQVAVSIDKPGFMLNPTSCAQKRIDGTVRSAAGASAAVGSRFQAAGCRALPYRPKLALQIGARGRTRNGVTTPFKATLTMPANQVANRAVTVRLPKTINSRLAVINEASCSLADFEAERCDKPIGTAVASTPVLRGAVSGRLFFVRNPQRRIPDLMVRLKGEGREAGVVIDLAGKVTIPRDLTLRTAFDAIPDVPISRFELNLVAGRRGAIGLVGNACQASTRRRSIANVSFRAHNGVLKQTRQRLTVAGCARASGAKQARRARK